MAKEGKYEQLDRYTLSVHKSLLLPDLVFGVGLGVLLAIISGTILLATFIGIYMMGFGVVAFIVVRVLCKKDAYLFEILFLHINQLDRYEG